MSVHAKLISTYNTDLMKSETVRRLVASVSQNAQDETVDFAKSKTTVMERALSLGEDTQVARREIISWLNYVHFGLNTRMGTLSSQDSAFWWEMHTRIQKLLVVAMVLEGDHLRSFGTPAKPVIPMSSDIPQCLIDIQRTLDELRLKVFPELKVNYSKRIKLCKSEYIELYTEGN